MAFDDDALPLIAIGVSLARGDAMLARLQQVTTLGLILTAVLWGGWLLQAGKPLWAIAGSALIVLGYAVFLGVEFVLLRVVNRGDPAPPASARQLLRAWYGEVCTAPRVFCWRQPFRSRAIPDWLPPRSTPGAPRGVVLVHGFVCNRGLWNPWMKSLRAAGVPYVAVNLEPVFAGLDAYTPCIEEAVRRVESATGRAPVIVAHSMGGLAVRAWWSRCATGQQVHRVVTIGTPHRGTWLGRYAFTCNGIEMRLDSPWQRKLAGLELRRQRLDPLWASRFTCFYSHCDNVVFPASTATLPGADNRHVAGSAHVHLAFEPVVFEEVLRRVAEPDAAFERAMSDQLFVTTPRRI
jgi:triacylglycerol lipase